MTSMAKLTAEELAPVRQARGRLERAASRRSKARCGAGLLMDEIAV